MTSNHPWVRLSSAIFRCSVALQASPWSLCRSRGPARWANLSSWPATAKMTFLRKSLYPDGLPSNCRSRNVSLPSMLYCYDCKWKWAVAVEFEVGLRWSGSMVRIDLQLLITAGCCAQMTWWSAARLNRIQRTGCHRSGSATMRKQVANPNQNDWRSMDGYSQIANAAHLTRSWLFSLRGTPVKWRQGP